METIFARTVKCAACKVNINQVVSQVNRKYCNLRPIVRNQSHSQRYESFWPKNIPIFTQRLHVGTAKKRRTDLKFITASALKKESGDEVDHSIEMDKIFNVRGFGDTFPDETTADRLFDGVKYADLPIVHVKVSRNNTIINFTDAKGIGYTKTTCGSEGFKNAKKGTNVAAQVTAQAMALKVLEQGTKTVRVTVNGLGPGRMASMKGLTLGGLNVVSVSDTTPLSFYIAQRPRKAKHRNSFSLTL